MACVLLPWLLVYLGLHVVQRGIIFIDIAMAQMASLGICIAVLLQFEPESLTAYLLGVAATVEKMEKSGIAPAGWVKEMLAAGLDTAVDKALLARIGDAFLALPEGFAAHPRVTPVLEKRREARRQQRRSRRASTTYLTELEARAIQLSLLS